MKIINAKAENFLSYKEFNYNFEDKGLTLIEGKDVDLGVNTGAGKSAFLDIICYGLFGVTSKKLKSDEVINWNVKKNLLVHLTIEHQGSQYIIKRYRKHKDHDNDFYILRVADQVLLRGKDSKETQKLLDGILGFNAEIFTKSVYFGQFDNVDKFLSATDIKKKELISEICDLSAYDEMLDVVKEDLKEKKEQLETLDRKIIPVESKNDTLLIKKDEMISSSARWVDDHNEELLELKSKSDTYNSQHEAKISGIKHSIERFESDKKTSLENISNNITQFELDRESNTKSVNEKIEAFERDLRVKISLATSNIDQFEQKRLSSIAELNSEISDITKEISEISEKIKKTEHLDTDDLEGQIAANKDKLSKLESVKSEISELEVQKAIVVNENNQLRLEIQKEKQKIKDNLGSDCPFCRQEMTSNSIEKHVKNLIDKGLKNKDSIEFIDRRIEEKNIIYKQKDEIDNKINNLMQSKQEHIKIEFGIRNLNSQQESLNNSITSKFKQIKEQDERVNPYTAQIEEIKGRKHGFSNELIRIKNEVNPYLRHKELKELEENPYFSQLEELSKTINPYPKMIDSVKLKQNPFNEGLVSINNEINDLGVELSKLYENKEEVSSEVDKGNFWKDALGVYIKSYLMDSFLSELNDQANIYLETLFNGVLRVQIDSVTETGKKTKEKISQKIYNGNIECSYDSLSGGERCRICLAINLALSDITCKTLGDSFSILMLDEILTGLDSSGKTQTMRLLKELEERFDTIFVIDHTEEFKSLFTNNITITKKGGFSNINQ